MAAVSMPHVLTTDGAVGGELEDVEDAELSGQLRPREPQWVAHRGAAPQALVDDEVIPVVAVRRSHVLLLEIGEEVLVERARLVLSPQRAGR